VGLRGVVALAGWQGPTRVNDTKQRDGTWQYMPQGRGRPRRAS
jgi:hypothetical protein